MREKQIYGCIPEYENTDEDYESMSHNDFQLKKSDKES